MWFIQSEKKIDVFKLLSLTIAAFIACPSYARTYRAPSRESIGGMFDQAIAQLDTNAKSFTTSRRSKARKNDVTDCIQSFVDNLNPKTVYRIEKNNVRSYPEVVTRQPSMVQARRVVKNKAKEILNASIDFSGKPVDLSDQDFYAALVRFKQNRDFGQLALQHVVDLLDDELNLVRHLIAGHTGIVMQDALDRRNNTLNHTIPLAIDLYDAILSVSTYANKHIERFNRHASDGKRLPKALTAYDQKMFLSTLENKIEKYQAIVRNLQYNLDNRASFAHHANGVDERVEAINKYLQTVI